MDIEADGGGATVAGMWADLLERHATAAVCALGPAGLSVDMPRSVPTRGHEVMRARSPLDVVMAEDRIRVVDAWKRVQPPGSPHVEVTVRLTTEPVCSVELHLLDARELHGVFLVVIVPTTGGGQEPMAFLSHDMAPLAPRTGRVRQDEVGVFLDVDDAICQILGWSREELVGRLSLEIIHPDDHRLATDNWMEMLASSAPDSRVRLRHRHLDGSWVWIEITNHNLLQDPDHRCVVAEMVNVSDEMAAHEALRAREQLLDRLAEALPVGVVQVGRQRELVYANSRLRDILDVPHATSVDDLVAAVLPADRNGLDDAFVAVLRDRVDSDLEVGLETTADGDGSLRRCLFSIRALTIAPDIVTGAIVCVSDVTDSSRLRDELQRRATFDEVTRCRNRSSTLAALEELLAATGPPGRPAVIFVDLDRFKEVNDRFGHAAGDELLAVVARRLLRAVRADDIVGRIGGDEFLVVRPGVTSARQAMLTATRIAATFRHEVRLKTGSTHCRASIGVAWTADPGLDAEHLIAMADASMYEAKRTQCGAPILHDVG